jgi:hypothetical protein
MISGNGDHYAVLPFIAYGGVSVSFARIHAKAPGSGIVIGRGKA